MKKFLIVILSLSLLFAAGCGCEGVVLDENEVIENNGTSKVIRGDVTYTSEGEKVYKNGELLAQVEGAKDDKVFALGEYLYKNTNEGAMQISIEKGKVKKFGSGEILSAKGRWIYYKSDDNKAKVMSMYKVDMIEGRLVFLFEGDTVSVEETEDNVLLLTTKDGKKYTNGLNSDEAKTVSE